MPRQLKLVRHLSLPELQARHVGATDRILVARWRALLWVAGGATGERAARVSGYSAKWVGQLVRRYNAGGPAAVADKRHLNRGARPLLTAEQSARLTTALEGPAPDGELWSGPKVAAWMSAELGRPVPPQRGWDYLRRCGFTPHRPRPRHAQADAAAQAAFPKASRPACKCSSTLPPAAGSNCGLPTNTGSG
jgi:transposase